MPATGCPAAPPHFRGLLSVRYARLATRDCRLAISGASKHPNAQAGRTGVVVGAPVAYLVVHPFLGPEAWKGYGALAGSWIGGTGNMAAVSEALDTPPEIFGLAVIRLVSPRPSRPPVEQSQPW